MNKGRIALVLSLVASACAARAALLVEGGKPPGGGPGNYAMVFKVTEDILVTRLGGAWGVHNDPNASSIYLISYSGGVLAHVGAFSSPPPGTSTWVMTTLASPLTLHPGTYALLSLGREHDMASGLNVNTSGGAVVPYDFYLSSASLSTSVFSPSGTESNQVPRSNPNVGLSWVSSGLYSGGLVPGFATMDYTVVPEPAALSAIVVTTLSGFAFWRKIAQKKFGHPS